MPPEKPPRKIKLLDLVHSLKPFDDDGYIVNDSKKDKKCVIETRRLDDPKPRRQPKKSPSRTRRPPKRFRSPSPPPRTSQTKRSVNSRDEPQKISGEKTDSNPNPVPEIPIKDILSRVPQSIKDIRAILSTDSRFSNPSEKEHRKRVTSKFDFSIHNFQNSTF